jgi:hypothetical protein
MSLTLSRLLLGLAVTAAGFGAAFAIGNATAGSDQGDVGRPRPLQVFTEGAQVPTLKRVEALPPLRTTRTTSTGQTTSTTTQSTSTATPTPSSPPPTNTTDKPRPTVTGEG